MREYDTAFQISNKVKESLNEAMKNANIDSATIESVNKEIKYQAKNEK